MFSNSTFRKLVQISEEALPLVHAPLILNNDFFFLTHQDVRKIEDTRLYTITKVLPNGDLKVINDLDAFNWIEQLKKQENLCSNQNFSDFLQFLIGKSQSQQLQQQTAMLTNQEQNLSNITTFPQPMEASTTTCENSNVASIEQQLQWNKIENTSAPFPMKYSQGTSTTEIDYKNLITTLRSMPMCNCCKLCQKCRSCKILRNNSTQYTATELKNECSKKSNVMLDAREQLKKIKKLSYSYG